MKLNPPTPPLLLETNESSVSNRLTALLTLFPAGNDEPPFVEELVDKDVEKFKLLTLLTRGDEGVFGVLTPLTEFSALGT